MLLVVQVHFWILRDVSWYASFTKKQGAYVDTQKWHDSGFLDNLGRSVIPLIETGQTGLDKFVKLQIGLHHCVDLVETIEIHI